MSKSTLARMAAISPETVRKLFTAGGNPEIRTVARLAAPLGLTARTAADVHSDGRFLG